jgi:methylthioribose-1-phosphate isomerase
LRNCASFSKRIARTVSSKRFRGGSPLRILLQGGSGPKFESGEGMALAVVSRLHKKSQLEKVVVADLCHTHSAARSECLEFKAQQIPFSVIPHIHASTTMRSGTDLVIISGVCNPSDSEYFYAPKGSYGIILLAIHYQIPVIVCALPQLDINNPPTRLFFERIKSSFISPDYLFCLPQNGVE